jgi:hypothetical protein
MGSESRIGKTAHFIAALILRQHPCGAATATKSARRGLHFRLRGSYEDVLSGCRKGH